MKVKVKDINLRRKVIVKMRDVIRNQQNQYAKAAVSTKKLLENNFGEEVIHKVANQSVANESIEIKGQKKRLEFIYKELFKKYTNKMNKLCLENKVQGQYEDS
jgi:hypothetical protein